MDRLKDRVAIVTGAAQGLGEAIAKRLAEEGCRGVAVADRNIAKAEQVAQQISDTTGCATLAMETDITSEADVKRLVEQTELQLGPLDILVANAGILKAFDIPSFPRMPGAP